MNYVFVDTVRFLALRSYIIFSTTKLKSSNLKQKFSGHFEKLAPTWNSIFEFFLSITH